MFQSDSPMADTDASINEDIPHSRTMNDNVHNAAAATVATSIWCTAIEATYANATSVHATLSRLLLLRLLLSSLLLLRLLSQGHLY